MLRSFISCLSSFFIIPGTFIFAGSFWDADCWHPIVGIESGVAISTDAGKSKTFPIKNPESDEFYSYSCQHKAQAAILYGGFVGAEWTELNHLGVQFDVNYNQSSPFSVKGVLTQGVDAQSEDSYHYKYKIIIRQLLMEGKLVYKSKSRFNPYLLLGLGASFNKAYGYSTTVPDSLTFTRVFKNNSTSSFTYAAGAGVDIDILQYLRAGIGYHFTNLGKAKLGSATIDNVSVSGTLSQPNFYANEIFLQLTAAF